MSKKYYYYLVFILIPVYIFSGSIIDYIHNRDNIVNTLEMPQKNYDNTISDSQKYELDIDTDSYTHLTLPTTPYL